MESGHVVELLKRWGRRVGSVLVSVLLLAVVGVAAPLRATAADVSPMATSPGVSDDYGPTILAKLNTVNGTVLSMQSLLNTLKVPIRSAASDSFTDLGVDQSNQSLLNDLKVPIRTAAQDSSTSASIDAGNQSLLNSLKDAIRQGATDSATSASIDAGNQSLLNVLKDTIRSTSATTTGTAATADAISAVVTANQTLLNSYKDPIRNGSAGTVANSAAIATAQGSIDESLSILQGLQDSGQMNDDLLPMLADVKALASSAKASADAAKAGTDANAVQIQGLDKTVKDAQAGTLAAVQDLKTAETAAHANLSAALQSVQNDVSTLLDRSNSSGGSGADLSGLEASASSIDSKLDQIGQWASRMWGDQCKTTGVGVPTDDLLAPIVGQIVPNADCASTGQAMRREADRIISAVRESRDAQKAAEDARHADAVAKERADQARHDDAMRQAADRAEQQRQEAEARASRVQGQVQEEGEAVRGKLDEAQKANKSAADQAHQDAEGIRKAIEGGDVGETPSVDGSGRSMPRLNGWLDSMKCVSASLSTSSASCGGGPSITLGHTGVSWSPLSGPVCESLVNDSKWSMVKLILGLSLVVGAVWLAFRSILAAVGVTVTAGQSEA